MSSKKPNLTDGDEYLVAICGGGGVGKSALTLQYVHHSFTHDYDPTIEDSYTKLTKVDNIPVKLSLLDTAGQEEYRSLRATYMRKQEGFVLVFSIDDKKSFVEINEFYQQILRSKEASKGDIGMVLVGNKCDLEHKRAVTQEEAKEYAKQIGVPYMETSALERKNVDEVFDVLVRELRIRKYPDIKDKKKCLVM